jgi:hypothetical protein
MADPRKDNRERAGPLRAVAAAGAIDRAGCAGTGAARSTVSVPGPQQFRSGAAGARVQGARNSHEGPNERSRKTSFAGIWSQIERAHLWSLALSRLYLHGDPTKIIELLRQHVPPAEH